MRTGTTTHAHKHAHTHMGLEGRPLFTRPLKVSRHLQRLRTYGEERWAQRQRSKQAQKKARRDRAQAAKPQRNPATPADRRRCPSKGGAKRSALHYGTDFYAKRTTPDGRRHPPLSSGGHGAREWEPGATYHTFHTTTRAHTATQAGDTQAVAKDVGVRGTRTPTVQSVRADTQGSTVLLCPRAPGAPAGACDVPPCRGASPHPTAPPEDAQSQPQDSTAGRGGQPPAPKRCVTHTPVRGGGGTHEGRPALKASSTPGARGRNDGGERHLPRTALRANEHAGRSGMGVQALRPHNPQPPEALA